MRKILNDIVFVFPVMMYYALEAIIVGFFIMIVWGIFLSQFLGDVGYLQIVAIYWIVKMLFFDVFKLIAGLAQQNAVNPPVEENPQDYNEAHEE